MSSLLSIPPQEPQAATTQRSCGRSQKGHERGERNSRVSQTTVDPPMLPLHGSLVSFLGHQRLHIHRSPPNKGKDETNGSSQFLSLL